MTSTLFPPQSFANRTTFGEPRLQTDSEVLLVSFGKEGRLYTMEEQGILRKWNVETFEQIEWQTLSDLETLWACSTDGRVFASGSDDLAIWDASSGQLLTSIQQPSWVTALAFHSDAGFVATGHDDGSIHYWDAPGHHPVFASGLLFHKKAISALAISPNGKYLAAASEDKWISLWDLASGKHLGNLTGHTDRVPALAWHPNSQWLVSVGWDTTARVWDAHSLQPVILLNSHATQVTAVAFSHDGRQLACADSTPSIHVWDFESKKTLHRLEGPQAEIRTLAFSPDGKCLACNGDRVIHLWNMATGSPIANLGTRAVARTTIAVHPDGLHLLSNGGGSALQVWNTANRHVAVTLSADQPVHALTYSPDGRWIVAANGSRLQLWSADGKKLLEGDGPEEIITTLAFSPDSTTLASGSLYGTSVWLWRIADMEPILLIPDALDGCTVESLAWHPSQPIVAVGGIDWMATGGSNGAISLWSIKDRCEVATFFEGTTTLVFHPTRPLLASSTLDHSICLWDMQKDQLQREMTGHEGAIRCLAFSPQGAWLASGGDDSMLRLWDLDGEERAQLEMDSQITALAFSPDGQYLYTAHANTRCSRIELPELFRRQ